MSTGRENTKSKSPSQARSSANVSPPDQTQLIDSAPLMGGARQLWFGKAIQDSAFLLAKLCHAASSLRRMERGGDTAEALMLKNETIKIINERLDQSSSHISEGTICTVACMGESYSSSTTSQCEGIVIGNLMVCLQRKQSLRQYLTFFKTCHYTVLILILSLVMYEVSKSSP